MVLLVPLSRFRPGTLVVVLLLIAAVFVGALVIKYRGEETLRRGETAQPVPTK